MTPRQFERWLATCGTDFDRWPPPLASQGRDMIARSPRARAAWRRAQGLDQAFALDRAVITAMDPSRRDRVVGAAMACVRRDRPIPGWGWWWGPKSMASIMAGAVAAGLAVGLMTAPWFDPIPGQPGSTVVSVLLGEDGPTAEEVLQ